MIAVKTLAGLACLLSQGASVDQVDPKGALSDAAREHLASMATDDACLPETLEAHIKQTNEKILSGELIFSEPSSPTRETGDF